MGRENRDKTSVSFNGSNMHKRCLINMVMVCIFDIHNIVVTLGTLGKVLHDS